MSQSSREPVVATRRTRSGSTFTGWSGSSGGLAVVKHVNRDKKVNWLFAGELHKHRDNAKTSPALQPMRKQLQDGWDTHHHPGSCAEARIEMAASYTTPKGESALNRVQDVQTNEGGIRNTYEFVSECSSCEARREATAKIK